MPANHKTKEPNAAAPAKAVVRRPCVTELVWDGKYEDEARTKRRAALRVALPFQTVETVNESAADRRETMELFAQNRETAWRNRLIWGDKKYVLPSLLAEFAGKVNLIYIDPPFDTGADFSFTATVPDHPDTPEDDSLTFTKEPSIIEHKAYRDTWGRGLDSYLQWFYETAGLLHELLHENGSLYVHLDWHVCHYARAVLDEVFGRENFQSEIIWKRKDSNRATTAFATVTDTILFFTKSDKPTWNPQFMPYGEDRLENAYKFKTADGRRYAQADLMAPGDRKGTKADYSWNGIRPRSGRHWAYTLARLGGLDPGFDYFRG